ncbi:polysaccharide pyruvyl transferase CsaB [Oceanobacillus senegalensis]|uniref:polysaccharide pyruvyl transferase CsaB n=1 Tax=Oceanobacillus senegalensis TaxID=1936063 RepID=UPI001FEA629D|nr:polysaccharide pyruvyl transferase CsaB [Oceanobacillus senegalensis]
MESNTEEVKVMHVVISGYYGFDNTGDEAILVAIIQALKKRKADIKITVLSHQPEKTRNAYGVHAISRWKIHKICRLLKKADGLISGGGSLLQDKTGPKSIPYYTAIIRMAKHYRKPVFIYAQGIGPIDRKLNQWIVKRILNKVDSITVRDSFSKELLEQVGVKKEKTIVPDPVLALQYEPVSCDWQPDLPDGQPYITVSVRNWETDKPYKRKIAASLDLLAQAGYAIVFVPMHGEQDEQASQETAAMMKEESFMAPGDLSPEEKVTVIGESKLLIGMRLHALIFSAISYTPFVAISYDPKITSFAAMCDQPLAGSVDSNDWNEQTLFDMAIHSLQDRHRSFVLNKAVRKFQQEAQQTPDLALEVIQHRALAKKKKRRRNA